MPDGVAAHTWQHATDAETRRLEKAVLLSPTLKVCEAMLRLEHVPIDLLDPYWVRKYGVRP